MIARIGQWICRHIIHMGTAGRRCWCGDTDIPSTPPPPPGYGIDS